MSFIIIVNYPAFLFSILIQFREFVCMLYLNWTCYKCDIILSLLLIGAFYLGYLIKGFNFKKKQHELLDLVKFRDEELRSRNEHIAKQSEEIRTHDEKLIKTNELLIEKQQLIEEQKNKLVITNEKLSQLNATKDKYFSIIAHDLRNSFNVVLGFAELLLAKNKQLPEEKVKRYIQLIYASSKNGNYLLENLLQWSRTQTGHISFEPVSLNLFTMVEGTLKLFESDIQRKNIQVNIDIDTLLEVLADENMIQTVLRNLLSNAIKFTYEKGSIIFRAIEIGSLVEVSIEDSGVGIPVENQKQLFNIENHISTQGTAHEHGTGLGLILCREFIEKHNGKLWVESELGRGSKFKFTIPSHLE